MTGERSGVNPKSPNSPQTFLASFSTTQPPTRRQVVYDHRMPVTDDFLQLWMGTHVKSPSGVVGSSLSLPDILAANPHLIGGEVSNKFPTSRGNLPFLFKVLSINKALSIQTHPDKKTAEQLHARQPTVYTGEVPTLADVLISFDSKMTTTSPKWRSR